MTQALNYCRDWMAYSERLLIQQSLPDHIEMSIKAAMDIAAHATKFVLPPKGILVEDNELKGLGDGPLHLPYKCIVLEYAYQNEAGFVPPPGQFEQPKRILFAKEYDEYIAFVSGGLWQGMGVWVTTSTAAIPKESYVRHDQRGITGAPAIGLVPVFRDGSDECSMEEWAHDRATDAWVLIAFLNALACSNVATQQADNPAFDRWSKLSPRKQARQLPPDLYHVLTIKPHATAAGSTAGAATGSDRKPVREHLRRGHIRRLANGARIWINAAVVMPGSATGRVTKDYRVIA